MAWGHPITDPTQARLERGLLSGIAAFRWATLAWMVTVLAVTRHDLDEPWTAVALVGVAFAFTLTMTVWLRRLSPWLLRAPTAITELVIGFTLVSADGWVYRGEHAQSFGSAWPLAGAMSLGVVVGPTGGLVAGVMLGLGRGVSEHVDTRPNSSAFSLVSTAVLYAMAGGVAGLVMRRLRSAELQISAARAREEVARTLHDGVLQTLAVVQRRSSDAELAELARDQELELRQFLFGGEPSPSDVGSALRHVVTRFQRVQGVRADLALTDDLPRLPAKTVEAVSRAVGEALTNAAKHAEPSRVVVFAGPDDEELLCSVKDDGKGFDPAAVVEGVGLGRSIRGRIAEVGGRVEVDGRPGRGTEVRIWVPM